MGEDGGDSVDVPGDVDEDGGAGGLGVCRSAGALGVVVRIRAEGAGTREDCGTAKAGVTVRALSRSTVAGRVFDTAVTVEVGSQRVFVGPRVLPPSRVGSRVRASVIDVWLVRVVDGDRSSGVSVSDDVWSSVNVCVRVTVMVPSFVAVSDFGLSVSVRSSVTVIVCVCSDVSVSDVVWSSVNVCVRVTVMVSSFVAVKVSVWECV